MKQMQHVPSSTLSGSDRESDDLREHSMRRVIKTSSQENILPCLNKPTHAIYEYSYAEKVGVIGEIESLMVNAHRNLDVCAGITN